MESGGPWKGRGKKSELRGNKKGGDGAEWGMVPDMVAGGSYLQTMQEELEQKKHQIKERLRQRAEEEKGEERNDEEKKTCGKGSRQESC